MTDVYSDRETEAMMADLESDRVERKESLQDDSPGRIREAVCAFAEDARPVRSAGLADLGTGRFRDEYLPAAGDPETLLPGGRPSRPYRTGRAVGDVLSAGPPCPPGSTPKNSEMVSSLESSNDLGRKLLQRAT